jgi:uncharacterized protein YbbC (DUF1343 family)
MIRFGIDQLLTEHPTAARIGLVTNDIAATVDGRKTRVALLDSGWNIVRLFSPEHGLAAIAEDGASVDDARDPLTNLPVVSLYGQSTRPPRDKIKDLDILLFDIPDVGARFYTYIWTLSHLLEACAEARKPLWVLDRPNPLGLNLDMAEGPMLDETFVQSFVGRWNMPIRYSLSIGELAGFWNIDRNIGADLRVIPCSGLKRADQWPDLNLPFIPTSPAMRDFETAMLYPATCLFEGTNLTEARGTDSPFKQIGAPWMDAKAICDAFDATQQTGVSIEPVEFTPDSRKFCGEKCNGIRLRVTDPRSIRPVSMGLNLLAVIIQRHRERFSWQPYPTAANQTGGGHFDKLLGIPIREPLERGEVKVDEWTHAGDWARRVAPHLIYT